MKAVGLTRNLPITDPESLMMKSIIPAALVVWGEIARIIWWMNEMLAKKPVSLSYVSIIGQAPDSDHRQ